MLAETLGSVASWLVAQAATLSDQDMQDIAAYFAGQGELEEGKPRSSAKIARGQEKAAVCAACHTSGFVSRTRASEKSGPARTNRCSGLS